MGAYLPEPVFQAFYSLLYRLLKIRTHQTFKCMPLFLANIKSAPHLSSVWLLLLLLNYQKPNLL